MVDPQGSKCRWAHGGSGLAVAVLAFGVLIAGGCARRCEVDQEALSSSLVGRRDAWERLRRHVEEARGLHYVRVDGEESPAGSASVDASKVAAIRNAMGELGVVHVVRGDESIAFMLCGSGAIFAGTEVGLIYLSRGVPDGELVERIPGTDRRLGKRFLARLDGGWYAYSETW